MRLDRPLSPVERKHVAVIGDVSREEGETWKRFPRDALPSLEKLVGQVVYTVTFCGVVETDKKGKRCVELTG